MNLHGIVAGSIGSVNPHVAGSLRVNTGSTKSPDGTRTPTYAAAVAVTIQVQPLSTRDLQQLEGLNLGGEKRKIYFYGDVAAVIRAKEKGGDLLTIASGVNRGTWLIVQSLEQYPDWVSCAVTLQND